MNNFKIEAFAILLGENIIKVKKKAKIKNHIIKTLLLFDFVVLPSSGLWSILLNTVLTPSCTLQQYLTCL